MAAYRRHITFSGLVGCVVGAGAYVLFGFTAAQCVLAAVLSWIAGMLPDLDSSSGRPVREVFSLLGAAAPLVLLSRLVEGTSTFEEAVLAAFAVYGAVRYGGAYLVSRMSAHRGMFHSVPAALIAGLSVFLCYKSPSTAVRALMAVGTTAGYLSHLVLDELYSVTWSGVRVELNAFAGSALKLMGPSLCANLVTYCLLAVAVYWTLLDVGWVTPVSLQQLPRLFQAGG